MPGESPPPPPRACFGRDELIEQIISLAEDLSPIALIGMGGIGKTAIALTVLHHDRVKQRFGENRRFIRCDQFPASSAHFLSRLSKVIGAGIKNPEDLAVLRPFLSSREMILFLDNAESILDPQGVNAQEIYVMVQELSQVETICLCITSRISTVPRHCKRITIPTLSMESACKIFYEIYDDDGHSEVISDLLRRLDFHALSITLLATTAAHNMWDYNRLAREWETHHVQMLQTDYNESLTATIELSLTSPTFYKLGSDARDLLGVIAFFPQGINEDNLDWLFPTIPTRRTIFDKSCVLSLTHRSDGFITMLAPLRDYLCPKGSTLPPLLHATKDHYFDRLSVDVIPGKPGFEEASWITSEDVNIEHLLDVFTTIDATSNNIWNVCCHFMNHLFWHKSRLVVLGQKFKGLPDNHNSKPQCLFWLSKLFDSVGNQSERKQLLLYILTLHREREDDCGIADTLRSLADANRLLGFHKEGVQQVKEALELYEQLNHRPGQAQSWQRLAWLLYDDKQLDDAEEAATKAIYLIPGNDDQFLVCKSHRILGSIYCSKGRTEEAIAHFEIALGIASKSNWHSEQAWIHCCLAELFAEEDIFDDAHSHFEQAKLYTIHDPYNLGCTMELQAQIWLRENKFEEATCGALNAIDIFQKLGATKQVEGCNVLLQNIDEAMEQVVPERVLMPVPRCRSKSIALMYFGKH